MQSVFPSIGEEVRVQSVKSDHLNCACQGIGRRCHWDFYDRSAMSFVYRYVN
jgi:hypothetical protein